MQGCREHFIELAVQKFRPKLLIDFLCLEHFLDFLQS